MMSSRSSPVPRSGQGANHLEGWKRGTIGPELDYVARICSMTESNIGGKLFATGTACQFGPVKLRRLRGLARRGDGGSTHTGLVADAKEVQRCRALTMR
jgi:hypothetical protein